MKISTGLRMYGNGGFIIGVLLGIVKTPRQPTVGEWLYWIAFLAAINGVAFYFAHKGD